MKNKRKKEGSIIMIVAVLGIALFGLVSYFIMNSNKTTSAIVPIGTIEAGATVTESMVQEIQIPADTPTGFLRNINSVVGYKLKTTVEANQLLYESDFMSSWTSYAESDMIPDDYVITSVLVPDERACGGLITAGDYVDIMLVKTYDPDKLEKYIDPETEEEVQTRYRDIWTNTRDREIEGRADIGVSTEYVIANALVLNTNSALASSEGSDLSVLNNAEGNSTDGSYYIFALSYEDAKKLRQAESIEDGKLWINICPAQNSEQDEEGKFINSPLIEQMVGESSTFLHDAQKQVFDKNGNIIDTEEKYYVPRAIEGTEEDAFWEEYSDEGSEEFVEEEEEEKEEEEEDISAEDSITEAFPED